MAKAESRSGGEIKEIRPKELLSELGRVAIVEADAVDLAHEQAIAEAKKLAKQLGELGGRFDEPEYALGSVLELYALIPQLNWKLEARKSEHTIVLKNEINEEKLKRKEHELHFIGALYLAALATGKSFQGMVMLNHEVFVTAESDLSEVEARYLNGVRRDAAYTRERLIATFGEG